MNQEQRTTKSLLSSIVGEGNLNLNATINAKVGIDNESFVKLFATIAIAGIVLFAVYFMLSKIFA
jgi:hypothetical protein